MKLKKIHLLFLLIITIVILLVIQHLIFDFTNKETKLEGTSKTMVVKYLLVDENKVNETATIDEVTDNFDTILYMSYGYNTLNINKDGDYEGKLNNANEILTNNIIDYAIALNDMNGNVLTDASFNKKTKKIIIPKKYYDEDTNDTVQLQVLIRTNSEKILNTTFKTVIKNIKTTKKDVVANGYDTQTRITLLEYDKKSKIDENNINIYINNKYKLTSDIYEYDNKSKTITISLNPMLINNIEIDINNKSIITKLKEKLIGKANALDIDERYNSMNAVKLSFSPDEKTYYTDASYQFNLKWGYLTEDALWAPSITFPTDSAKQTEETNFDLLNAIDAKSGSARSSYLYGYYPKDNDGYSTLVEESGNAYAYNQTESNENFVVRLIPSMFGGNDESDFFTTSGGQFSKYWTSLYCGHISDGVELGGNERENTAYITANIKILYRNSNSMIVQIVFSQSVFTQLGYGVYKFYWEDTKAAIEVDKEFKDGENEAYVPDKSGVEFTLYNDSACSSIITSGTTDTNGKITFTDLKINTSYFIKETSLGTNFNTNDWTMDSSCTNVVVTNSDDKDSTNTYYLKKITKTNRRKHYCIKVKKVDKYSGESLQGISFKAVNKSTGTVYFDGGVTNSNGEYVFKNLDYSASGYDITEVTQSRVIPTNKTIRYWNDGNPTTASLNVNADLMTYSNGTYSCPGAPSTYTFTDSPIYYCLSVKKIDAITGTALQGAVFTATLGNKTYKETTDRNGIATFMVDTNEGNYTVTEITAPSGYAISLSPTKTITATEMPQSTTKEDSTNKSKCNASTVNSTYSNHKYVINWYKETEKGTRSSGAKFIVKNTNNQYIKVKSSKQNQTDANNVTKTCYVYEGVVTSKSEASTLISDSNGEVCISGLSNGTYNVTEITPSDNHTFGKDKEKNITTSITYKAIDASIDSNSNTNKFVNYNTTFEFTKEVTYGDETDKKIVINGVEKTLKDLTIEELKKIEFNVYDSNNNILSFIKTADGEYEYSENSIDAPSGNKTTSLYLNDNRKIKINHLKIGTYSIKEKNSKSCESSSNYENCVGYYYPDYNSINTTFEITNCSSDNATSCSSYGKVKMSLSNTPTEITFTKKDLYNYYDASDKNKSDENVTFVDEKERNDFDKIVFKLKDSNGKYLTLKKVRDVGDCTDDNSYSEYRYVSTDSSSDAGGTELHTCGGHIKITNLCRGNTYVMEEVTVPEGSVYVKENTTSTPTSVEYKIPCTSSDSSHTSTTNIINNKPTRVRFEKRDSKYGYAIIDETTTFEVYKCPKDTKCNPSDYKTVEEREKAGMTLVKFNERGVISGDEEDAKDLENLSGVEVYRKISDSDVKKGQKYVTELHPYNGILVLRYLESGYNYVLLETVAPKNYTLPKGRDRETQFTVTNTTVSVDEVDVANKPTSLIIRKYTEEGKLLAGAEFKIYEGTKCDSSLSAMNQPKTLLKLKTIRDGVYENRPNKDTETIKTCEDKEGSLCSDINSELTYEKYQNTFADFNTSLNEENERVSIKEGEALVQYLEYGHCYIIEEVKAPKGYTLPEKEEDRYTMVTIEENRSYVVDTYKTFINKPTPFTFYKYDEYNQLLDGAEFKLQKLNDDKKYEDVTVTKEETETGVFYKVDSKTDNKTITTVNGSATVYYLEEGQYRIIETKAAEGKELNKNPNVVTFFVDENGNVYGSSVIVNKAKTETEELKSSASAELIVNVRTGVTVVRYGLIISTIIALVVGLMIALRIKNKD